MWNFTDYSISTSCSNSQICGATVTTYVILYSGQTLLYCFSYTVSLVTMRQQTLPGYMYFIMGACIVHQYSNEYPDYWDNSNFHNAQFSSVPFTWINGSMPINIFILRLFLFLPGKKNQEIYKYSDCPCQHNPNRFVNCSFRRSLDYCCSLLCIKCMV